MMRSSVHFWLNRPEYWYQPTKLLKRLVSNGDSYRGVKIVELPWNLPVEVDCSDVIGVTIAHHGVFELPVVEAVFRLVDPCDVVLDVGANLGYMTSAALAAGAKKVICFEPHPVLFAHLARNVRLWTQVSPEIAGRAELLQQAVSSGAGTAVLRIPCEEFQKNRGIATLETGGDPKAFDRIEVTTTTLDMVVAREGPIGLLKIDIEGHEMTAFSAGRDSLGAGMIRDIVYEDFGGMASQVSNVLRGFGYELFGIQKSVTGPVLLKDTQAERLFGSTNLIATLDPARLQERMAKRGYKCLHS